MKKFILLLTQLIIITALAGCTPNELNQTPWIWFMTWHTEYLTDKNDNNALKELYNSDYVITLDEIDIIKGNNV